MPGLHLHRMPYDLFPYDFSGIVGGYGVGVYIDTSNVRFLVRTFGDGPGQSRTETVRRSLGKSYSLRTEIVHSSRGVRT